MKQLSILLLLINSIQLFSQDFITRKGKHLLYQDSAIYLRGMAFGNLVWDNNFSPTQHHSEIDYQRLEDLGMNAIRFYLSYETFENDDNPYQYKTSGWDWIDQNIEWAKAHNIFLILNMHVPQGGFQSQCDGDSLWLNTENQNRLAALWKEIAKTYKDEPQIAGFDILNEPIPTTSINQWTTLAQQIIDSIRQVDTEHLIITERAIALDCDYSYADENNNYPQITEENLMYTVHLYDPHEYTHQNLSWAGTGDGGKYPDYDLFTTPADIEYYTGNYNNSSIATGTNDWTLYTGSIYQASDTSILTGRVIAQAKGIKEGKVYFDDFMLLELNSNNEIIDTIFNDNPSEGTYWWWSEDGSGSYTEETEGHGDNYSISITGSEKNSSVNMPNYTFRVTKGAKYQVIGYMKTENMPASATANFTTEYYYSPSHQKLRSRDYDYLKDRIISSSNYIQTAGYPVYFGEYGAARTCFVDGKGGEQWVADAMHIFDSLGFHFTYHSYKESSFGLYDGWEKPVDPNTINAELEQVFKDFYSKPPTKVGLSTLKIDEESGLKIVPNPSSDFIKITTNNNDKIESIELYNSMGQKTAYYTDNLIDTSSLKSGTYFVRIHFENTLITKTFVKK